MNYKQFIKLLGPKTTKVKLKPKIVKSKKFEKFTLETIEYNVEKNERVRSLFLLPHNIIKKVPAIICHHQHASKYNIAKSEMAGLKGNNDLAYAKELAERGFVAFAPDSIAFEERNKLKSNWWGVEYFELASRIIQGKTLLEKTLSDLSVATDYLITRSEVNKNKIGFIGHSYGGRMAILFPAYDKRIKASVSNCYARKLKYSLDINSNTRIPMELVVPNLLKYGDFDQFTKLVPPCNLMLSVAKKDKWSQDALKIYRFAKPFFKKSELKIKFWPGKHSFKKKMRNEAYNFLVEKLK